jgi:hypothetical protein
MVSHVHEMKPWYFPQPTLEQLSSALLHFPICVLVVDLGRFKIYGPSGPINFRYRGLEKMVLSRPIFFPNMPLMAPHGHMKTTVFSLAYSHLIKPHAISSFDMAAWSLIWAASRSMVRQAPPFTPPLYWPFSARCIRSSKSHRISTLL